MVKKEEKMNTKKIKKAFTLAEIMIVLTIVAVLSTILLKSMDGMTPDKEIAYFKKAYSVGERIIAELVSDETLYPYDANRGGFLNTDCVEVPGTADQVGPSCPGATDASKRKFCELFKSKVNVLEEITASNQTELRKKLWTSATLSGTPCLFQTSDGIVWFIDTEFKCDPDASGKCKPASSIYSVNVSVDYTLDTSDNDPLSFAVSANGRITVDGEKEREILRSSTVTKKKNE